MWVLALGTNDRLKSSAQLRTDANTVLSAIGPDHFVWIGIGFYAGNDPVAARVNSILSEAVAAAPNGSYTSWNSWIHSPLRGSGANWVYPARPDPHDEAGIRDPQRVLRACGEPPLALTGGRRYRP
jgi:hypothetical protein